MAKPSLLPERLRYLQPFRRKFASRAAEALNEDTGTEPLIGLLAKRINGLSAAESEKTLGLDLDALEKWLGQPGNANDCLQFVRGFFLVGSLNQIVEIVREESKKQLIKPPLVEMDWPPGAKMRGGKGVRKEGGFWLRWKKLDCVMDAVSEEASLNFADAERRREADYETIEISPVRFGEAHGQKFVRIGKSDWCEYKRVSYVLNVPGGFIYGSVDRAFGKNPGAANWDESELENYFKTLRIVASV